MLSNRALIGDREPWDGSIHGKRYTGIGMVEAPADSTDETNFYLASFGYELKLSTETNEEWHRRTNGGKGFGEAAVANVVELKLHQESE